MFLVDFDCQRFADDVAAKVRGGPKGLRTEALRRTGIPAATFQRMMDGTPPRNIEAILSAAGFFGMRLVDYVTVQGKFDLSGEKP